MRLAHYSTVAGNEKIDTAAGVIYGVSVITLGHAQGHRMEIDSTTLDQILAVAKTHKDGIKVKFGNDHKAGVDDTTGVLRNFRKDGDQVRADLHLLKTDPHFSKIIEMAETMPNEFGLSAVFSGEHEETKDAKFARCTEIYSVDLVSDPAANPSGLFSKPSTVMNVEIKSLAKLFKLADTATESEVLAALAKAQPDDEASEDKAKLSEDGKTHTKECMCKECKMSKSKKSMNEILTPEFVAELKKLMPDTTTELATKLKALETANANNIALAKKAELDSLVAEANRNGQVIPLENDDIYTVKDGIVTIGTEPEKLKKMLAKLPKGAVKLDSKPTRVAPTDAEGKTFDRHTPEGRAKVIEFCRQKQAENIAALGAEIKRLNPQTN